MNFREYAKEIEMSDVEQSADQTAELEKAYNDVTYTGRAHTFTHPSHLGMVAKVLGLSPTDPHQCRVLELGCSIGSNLLPIADSLPNSEFVGVDLSPNQIEQGQKLVEQSGLTNISLLEMDIAHHDELKGEFDYIICHGVYSWVPPHVQEAIINVGAKLLSPNGVMMISYNTLPGWNLRGVIRDMMLYHVQQFDEPREKVGQARALLNFLAKSVGNASKSYTALIEEEAKLLAKQEDSYIYHEHLAVENSPIYFHEFADRVNKGGLQYFADTTLRKMIDPQLDKEAMDVLNRMSMLQREQFRDYMSGGVFRRSLLCRPDVSPDYGNISHHLSELHVQMVKLNETAGRGGEVLWEHPTTKFSTMEPITTVFRKLCSEPVNWTPVAEVLDGGAADGNTCEALLATYLKGLCRFAYRPPNVCPAVPQHPKCSQLVRMQAEMLGKATNRGHQDVQLPLQRKFLISLLDGTNSIEELIQKFREAVAGGVLSVRRTDDKSQPVDDPNLEEIVKSELEILRQQRLLDV